MLDDVRIYNRALETSEIEELYESGVSSYATGECNDADDAIHPGVEDLCGDVIDNNCDGQVDRKAGSPVKLECEFCDHYQLTIPYSECKALEALYGSTNGGNWTSNTGWLVDPEVNNWFGITTTLSGSQAYVSKICLGDETDGDASGESCNYNGDGNNLEGPLPDEIGDFPELQRLVLSRNS